MLLFFVDRMFAGLFVCVLIRLSTVYSCSFSFAGIQFFLISFAYRAHFGVRGSPGVAQGGQWSLKWCPGAARAPTGLFLGPSRRPLGLRFGCIWGSAFQDFYSGFLYYSSTILKSDACILLG